MSEVMLEPIRVEYVEHGGSDLSVVNAARASFSRVSDWEWDEEGVPRMRAEDVRLIRFLARGCRQAEWDELLRSTVGAVSADEAQELLHRVRSMAQHWTPFAHPHVTLRLRIPLFAARQLVKHQVGGVWSEVSRRYVSSTPTYWLPQAWCDRPEDIKQGCGAPIAEQAAAREVAVRALRAATDAYERLLALGVAPEEARLVLPVSHMTTVVWTGSLLFWARVVNLRADAHAQRAATREIAGMIADIMGDLFPVSWPELVVVRSERGVDAD